MAGWDDVSAPAQATPQAGSWDAVSAPVPKGLPDTSTIQDNAHKNLTAPTEGEGEPKTLSNTQKLDTAVGFPASSALSGGNVPLPPEWRKHVVDSYKNGTSSNAGDFMATALHSVVPIVAGAVNRTLHPIDTIKNLSDEIGGSAEQISQRYVGTMAYPFLSRENQLKLEKAGIVPPPGGEPISPDSPQWVKALHGFSEGVQGTLGTALSAPFLAVTAGSAPIINSVIKSVTEASPSGYQSVMPDLLNLAMTFGGLKGLHYIATRPAPGTQFPPGQGPWDNHPGADVMREMVNKDNPESVTSSQIDQHIMQSFEKSAPAAQDFHDVSKIMSQVVYHGTPYEFDKFSGDKIGTGEGADAFGHGHYFTDNKEIADYYKNKLSDSYTTTPKQLEEYFTPGKIVKSYGGQDKVIAFHPNEGWNWNVTVRAVDKDGNFISGEKERTHSTNPKAEELQKAGVKIGNTYEAIIPHDDELLRWDKPLSQQSDTIKNTIESNMGKHVSQIKELDSQLNEIIQKEGASFYDPNYISIEQKIKELKKNIPIDIAAIKAINSGKDITGEELYRSIANKFSKEVETSWGEKVDVSDNKAASDYLHSIGIKGIKYPANTISVAGKMPGGHNYVIFNDKSVQKISSSDLVDTLHNIYTETGLRPEQVFEDARRDPSIKEDIGAGKFPTAYEHLKDTRPPIPDDVQAAMDRLDKMSKEEPPVEMSKEGASQSSNPFVKIFNPAGMSESARDMATALRQGRGPENRDIASIQDSMQKYAKTFTKMSDEERLKFINYIETRSKGAKLDNPELQEAADKIKDIYAQVAAKIQERFPDVGLRQDYFTHQYKDEAAAEKFFSDWVAKQGSEGSLKARAFPTLAEAMEAGLEPKTTNPIETVMNYATNMGNLFAAHRSIELAQEMGIADYFRKGQQPAGWEPLNGNLGEKNGKILYAPEDAARVYGNDISKGFTGPAGDILQGVNRINNFGNMLVLSASMFHFTVTTLSSMAQDVGRAFTTGTIGERAASLARAVTPAANTLRGEKYMQASLYPEAMKELSPELQRSIDLAWKNNAVNLRNQDYWKAGPAKDYFDIFKNGGIAEEIGKAKDTFNENKLTGPVKILANEVGRVMNTVSHPLMDTYIPRIKFAATVDNIHAWLKSHPDATPEQIDRAVQDIGNNADNAFGEMMRDNLFWHKITQQTLQTTFLSYSWITGALRMAGKGVPDIGKAIMGKKELTADAKYLIGMAATYTVANGVMTYLKTGHAPDDPMDLLAYRTGGTTAQGKEERAFIPSHFPQYWHYLHDALGELGNETSPTMKVLYHVMENKDWRDLPITNENNTWFTAQKWGDYAKYVAGEETPIGIKTLLQGKKKGSDLTDLERFMGIRQAPRQFTDPEGYDDMMRSMHERDYNKKLRSDEKMQQQYE